MPKLTISGKASFDLKLITHPLPGAKKAIKMLIGVSEMGAQALVSRLSLYRTGNLEKEARKVADATGLPLPIVFDNLARQRSIDEVTLEALQRVSESVNVAAQDEHTPDLEETDKNTTSDSWYHTIYEQAGAVDDENVREAFVRILAGEIQKPNSFSLQTLRVVRGLNQTTAKYFWRAASVSISLVGVKNPDYIAEQSYPEYCIAETRIPAVSGRLSENSLLVDGLSYSVLLNLTENGLLHSVYDSQCSYEGSPSPDPKYPYAPKEIIHQGVNWFVLPKSGQEVRAPLMVSGAMLTSCGIELLKIVDIEPLPEFTERLKKYLSEFGYEIARKA